MNEISIPVSRRNAHTTLVLERIEDIIFDEICDELGDADPKYFHSVVKRITGAINIEEFVTSVMYDNFSDSETEFLDVDLFGANTLIQEGAVKMAVVNALLSYVEFDVLSDELFKRMINRLIQNMFDLQKEILELEERLKDEVSSSNG